MNAKIGKQEEYRPTIGKYNLDDELNDNGFRLLNLASARNTVVVERYSTIK